MTLALLLGIAAGLLLGIGLPLLRERQRRAATADHDEALPMARPAAASTRATATPPPAAGATGRFPKPAAPARPGDPGATGSFRAVTVRTGANCCEAVRPLSGQRFLSTEAPPLPVAGCDRRQCGCSYQRLPDRRNADDRRFGIGSFGGYGAGTGRPERRAPADRRKP